MKLIKKIIRKFSFSDRKTEKVDCHYCSNKVELKASIAHVLIACDECKKKPIKLLSTINEYTF